MKPISDRLNIALAKQTFFVGLLLISPVGHFLMGQQLSSTSVPPLFTQSISAMSGGVELSDVTLTGTVDYYNKSGHESGTITLRATASGSARVDVELPSGGTSEMIGIADSRRYGKKQDHSGIHPISLQNLQVDAAWFAPVITLTNMNLELQQEASIVILPPAETDPGDTTHLRFSALPDGRKDSGGKELFRLSREDVFIKTSTLLPSEIRFHSHPEENSRVNKPVKIEYLSYATFNGVMLPSRIRKTVDNDIRNSLDGKVILDIVITSVAINSGLTDASLQVQ